MNIWSPDSLQQRPGRKVVPEGSNHFQRVLDDIVYSENNIDIDQCKGKQFSQHEENKILAKERLMLLTNKVGDSNNNDTLIGCSCKNYKSRQQCQICQSNTPDTISFSNFDTDCFNKIVNDRELENEKKQQRLTFLESDTHISTMGASCSSSFYDNREWHNVKGDISIENGKPKKRGRLLKKRASSERSSQRKSIYTSNAEPCSETSQTPSNFSKCQQHHDSSSDVDHATRPQSFQANGIKSSCDKRLSLSPDDIPELCCNQLTSNRLSPNVDSAGHVHLSRVVGSGRARATAECDVSPHRLLTRRSNSPNSQSPRTDLKISNDNQIEERPRSQSWSNGKFGSRANFKTSSLTIRQSLRNLKANSPLANRASKNVTASIPTVPKCVTTEAHESECPLNIKPEDVPKISISKPLVKVEVDFDPDMPPIVRRRAASESQTMRPRRLLPRTPDSSDQIQEHAHVRWADEKKGSSLSTSVFVTSIRPRSRSYGAMDSVPHRPILKKVAGL